MTLSRRLWASALLLLVLQIGAIYVERGYTPAEVFAPSYEVTELPDRLGEWRSDGIITDAQIAVATGADATVDRRYSKPGQAEVAVHFGRWCEPESRAPHLPQACYSGAGWTKQDEEPVVLSNATDRGATALIITWARDNERVRSLHWYRRGEQTYSDWTAGTEVYRNLWGNRRWPVIEKLLLQTDFDDKEASEKRLVQVAAEIDHWMMSAHSATRSE